MNLKYYVNKLLAMILCYWIATKTTNGFECAVSVRIDSGWLCGLLRETEFGAQYASFRGIPYARQPLGKLRFNELEPVESWPHYYDATEEGPVCPQEDVLYGNLVKPHRKMNESCIYVNIHVPLKALSNAKGPDKTGYPVLVFIHGGGFSYGSGDSDIHGPDYLVNKGLIVVTFNYRLNVFGFLSLNTTKVPGNNGLRDQLTLLRWIQRNVGAFGGDPQNVTLAGQSAGAVSAHLLALSNHSRGLFKRLILMSGTGVPAFYTPSPIYASEVAAKFLKALGINSTDPNVIHDILVAMPIEKIMKANSRVLYEVASGTASFMPVVEGNHPGITRIVDDDPVRLIYRGRDKLYPMIVGITNNECESLKNRFEEIHLTDRIEKNPELILDTRIPYTYNTYLKQYLAKTVASTYFHGNINIDEFMAPCENTLFKYPAFQLAQWRGEIQAKPTYMYQFTYESEHSILKEALNIEYRGNAHIEDVSYIFRADAYLNKDLGVISSRDDQMKDWITTLFYNFVRCEDPSCGKGWPPINPQKLNYQSLYLPGVYNNTLPTNEEWNMIHFNDKIHHIAIYS